MTTYEEHRQDLQNMIDDFPQTFTYGGEEFIGTRTRLDKRNALEPGGYSNEYDVFVIIGFEKRVGLGPDGRPVWGDTFGDEPEVGEAVIMDGVRYRIGRTVHDELNVSLQIDLETDQE